MNNCNPEKTMDFFDRVKSYLKTYIPGKIVYKLTSIRTYPGYTSGVHHQVLEGDMETMIEILKNKPGLKLHKIDRADINGLPGYAIINKLGKNHPKDQEIFRMTGDHVPNNYKMRLDLLVESRN